MNFFTARNTVILALVQQGVVTFGVLAAGAAIKWRTTFGVSPPEETEWFSVFGAVLLLPPLVWVTYAYFTLHKDDSTDNAKLVAVGSGILLLIGNLIAVWYGAGRHLFYMGCGGLSN
jgi:hypothetical protein